jgi:hypothetical protein
MENFMRRALAVAAMVWLAGFHVKSAAQSSQSADTRADRITQENQIADLHVVQHTFRPKLPLQEALKIAEDYIDKSHIDISSYWLLRANFILWGEESAPDSTKIPCWHFWWVNDNGALGDYVEIIVTMDGKATRAPSM